ncbi:MAG TPA: ThaI family type II restriction endonuclease [Chitinophagales bacterium]|nr:ThaI family type II restriction endonuclease [Chitinophagales bacterium]HRK28192.1 ThaI family type II restriction endonuclease [Chitinophagales bacterium]
MANEIHELFADSKLVEKIRHKLPQFFRIAEIESSRAGKIGMEVGSVREKIITSLLIFKFGFEKVKTDIPITEPEVDVILCDKPISIKTVSGKHASGVKLIWTVDAQKSLAFSKNYQPTCDILLVHIWWDNTGGLYYIPKEVQQSVLKKIGNESYIKLPKQGTNPRGVEMTGNALKMVLEHPNTIHLSIEWKKETQHFTPFDRWVELWQKD